MKKRKMMALLLSSVMAVSMVAPVAVQAESSDPIEITFWHAMGGTNGEVLQEIVDDFNASQDEIYVTTEYQGTYDDTITKLKAAMQSNEGLPDITQMYDVGTQFMYDSGSVIAVEDMFETTGYDSSTVMEQITSYYTVDGKQWSMPFNVSTPMLYYNKDAFEEAGLDPDTAPTTYEEVLECAQTIVDSGAANYGYAQAIYGWFFEQQLAGLGLTYGDNDNGRSSAITSVEFDSNGGGLQILETWKTLYDSGVVGNYGTNTADTQTAFFSGDTAMIIESTAILANATESSPFEIGTAYLPRVSTESEDGGVIIGGGSLWMLDTGDEEREQAAWKFIEYITNAEVQAKWSMGTGYFAINEATYETDEMVAYLEENPNFETAINQLNDSPVNTYTAGVLSGVQTEARLLFNEVIEQIYDGSMTPEEGVESLAADVNSAIENYNASLE
ncbi:MAG: ABC transporter substrate-binding protein [Clostridiales bacterium]|nr:ABC transporter substrate-binding protein [Clostridiales bacterium]